MDRNESESAIPSVTETLRMQREEEKARERGVETAASRRTARLIAQQNGPLSEPS